MNEWKVYGKGYHSCQKWDIKRKGEMHFDLLI